MTFDQIYKTLLTKCPNRPRNLHYLRRYVNFIEWCSRSNDGCGAYYEKHHIVPKGKSFWPEFKSFKSNSWNMAKLTGRQHYIAHWMLARALGGGMWMAFDKMHHSSDNHERKYKVSSKAYEELQKQKSEYLSSMTKARYNRVVSEKEIIKTTIENLNDGVDRLDSIRWVNDGKTELMTDCALLPKEFVPGRISSSKEHLKDISTSVKGRVWVTNGVDEIMVDCECIPEGYTRGRSATIIQPGLKGESNGSFGKIWVTNGVDTIFVDASCVPEGYARGVDKERKRNQSNQIKGRVWYNNGVNEICISEYDEVPEGYTRGRLKYKCNHCGILASKSNLSKYHLDNCKNKGL